MARKVGMEETEAMGTENPNRASHPLSKNFRDPGGSRANVDEKEANGPLSPSIWASARRPSSQLSPEGNRGTG